VVPGVAPNPRNDTTSGSRRFARWRGRWAAHFPSLDANRTLLAVSGEGFLTRLGFGMVGFALPLYALSLGFGLGEIGLLYTLRTGTTIMVKPAMAWAADRFGRKRVLVLAVLLRCLVGLLFVFSTLGWQLYVLRFLQGAMTAARDPSASALIAEHADKRTLASAFAWYSTARSLGQAIGYAAAGLLLFASGSFQVVFLMAFLSSCVALVTVVRYVWEHREAEAGPPPPLPAVSAVGPGWVFYRGLLPHATFGLMVASGAEMMSGLFPVIATEYAHLTEAEAGLAAGASAVTVLVGGPVFGWLSDHVSRNVALGTRSLANFFSSLLYIGFPSFGGFLVARVMDDTGKAAFRPTWGAILAEASNTDPARRARTMTFVDSAYTLGEVLAPVAAGVLIAAVGLPGMLGVRAAVSLVAEGQALWVFRYQQRSRGAACHVAGVPRAGDQSRAPAVSRAIAPACERVGLAIGPRGRGNEFAIQPPTERHPAN
jgi:MFS family permease